MRKEMRLLNHEKRSRYLREYGFAIYCNEPDMQDLFKMLDERGYLNKFELEKNEGDGFVKAYIDGQLLSGMSDDDSKFLGEVIDRIGFVLITAEVMQRDDEHYPKKKLEKNRQKKYYYLSATIYYFDEIVSEEKRNKIIDQELSYENYEPPKPGKKIGRKSSGFMIILNSLLALVSIGFAVYCYFHGLKGYGIFMVVFAVFFITGIFKFRRMSAKHDNGGK